MKSLNIHGAMDLRIEDFPLDNLSSNQVEISVATGGIVGRTSTIINMADLDTLN